MKQSNSASINFTIIYIVKEHRHILLYFYTHHLAHIDYKIRRMIALSNCYPGCCMHMLILLFVFVILYIVSCMTHYLKKHGTIEQYRATLGFQDHLI